MKDVISINGRLIGKGHPCFIIAEAGVNHAGDAGNARQLVDLAAKMGVDAVKFQTFNAERLVTTDAPKAEYQRETTGEAGSQLDMLRQLELSAEAHCDLMVRCRQHGIMFLSTPFDEESAAFLHDLGVSAFKIPSGEITNFPLLVHIARMGKPIIMSTGMSTLSEVEAALQVIRGVGGDELILLHCVSNYPARPNDANLRAMLTMASVFGVPVGYSDHTMGIEVSLAAVALGACVIEKHLTLDRSLPGPDHRASLEPEEFAALVAGIRKVELALGDGKKQPAQNEKAMAAVARKSLVAARDIAAGSRFTEDMIAVKRPGTGLPPSLLPQIIGRRARRNLAAGTVLMLDMVI